NAKKLDSPMSFPLAVSQTDDGTEFSLAISKSSGAWNSGAEQNWNIAYYGPFFVGTTCCNSAWQLRIARVNAAGGTTLYPTAIWSFGNQLPGTNYYAELYSAVSVSTSQPNPSGKFMVAFDVNHADGTGTPHIFGAIVDPSTIS